MINFNYKTVDNEGKRYEGVLEAEDISSAAARLREHGYHIVNLTIKKDSILAMSVLKKKVTAKDLAQFCQQLSTMIDAGVSLLSSLEILQYQTDNPTLKSVLAKVKEDLKQGNAFSESLSSHPKIFNVMMVKMVEAGEHGGVLDEIFLRLAEHYQKEHDLNEKIRGAMTYPVVVLIAAFLAMFLMLTFVLPRFALILNEMAMELPLPTMVILTVSTFTQRFWYLVLLFTGLTVFMVYRYTRTTRGKQYYDRIKLKFPVFGDLTLKIITVRFCHILGLLLAGGVPVLHALEVARNTTDNYVFECLLDETREVVRDGQSMSIPISEARLFPPMVAQMIKVGEETGTLDNLLLKAGAFYQKEVDNKVAKLSILLEPIMIIFLGGIVGFLVLAIMLPMFNMVTGF